MLAGVFEGDGLLGRMGVGWQKIVPFDHAGVLALTIVLATTIPHLINRILDAEEAANRWALVNESSRGRLLRESFEKGHLLEGVAERRAIPCRLHRHLAPL